MIKLLSIHYLRALYTKCGPAVFFFPSTPEQRHISYHFGIRRELSWTHQQPKIGDKPLLTHAPGSRCLSSRAFNISMSTLNESGLTLPRASRYTHKTADKTKTRDGQTDGRRGTDRMKGRRCKGYPSLLISQRECVSVWLTRLGDKGLWVTGSW